MTPILQAYANYDKGYKQFCEKYKMVASDPATRNEFFYWNRDRVLDDWEKMAARDEGIEEGRQEGRQEGMFEKTRNTVLKMTNAGMEDAFIAEMLDFSVAEINKYR